MIVVDSSVWIDFFAGQVTAQTDWLRAHGREQLGVPDLVLCEVLQGVRHEVQAVRVSAYLRGHTVLHCGGAALSSQAALNYRLLRARGYTVRSTIDCLIATFCLTNDHTLLHRDRDFDLFERELGLQVLHP